MATTQIKDGFAGGSDNQLKVNSDGSINIIQESSVQQAGLTHFQTSQYTVGTSVVQITPTPLPNRSSVSFRVEADAGIPVYIANNPGVSSTNGYPLYDGDTLAMDLTPTDTIYAISTRANQTLAVLELA